MIIKDLTTVCSKYFPRVDLFMSSLSTKGTFSSDDWLGIPIATASIAQFLTKLGQTLPSAKHLILYSDYCGSNRRMTNLGLQYIVDAIETESLPKEEAENQLYYSVYRSIANELLHRNPL
jgi:hypothetical protein